MNIIHGNCKSMNIIDNGDMGLREVCDARQKGHRWRMGARLVTIFEHSTYVDLSCNDGEYPIKKEDTIHVMRKPFDYFGLKTIKPLKERVQKAADVLNRRCDVYNLKKETEYVLEEQLSTPD